MFKKIAKLFRRHDWRAHADEIRLERLRACEHGAERTALCEAKLISDWELRYGEAHRERESVLNRCMLTQRKKDAERLRNE